MLAKLFIKLPFTLLVPEGAKFHVRGYIDGKYTVQYLPPMRSDYEDQEWAATLYGEPAFFADVLVILFRAADFDRTISGEDPPRSVVDRAIDELLSRLRYVTKSQFIVEVSSSHSNWRLSYLQDDGTELLEEKGLVKGRGVWGMDLSWTLCTPEVWDAATLLDSDELPQWRSLLTDAVAALPHIGTSVVLTATSLEVMISDVLARLQPGSSMSNEIWAWINKRSNKQFNPTVDEQFTDLLNLMSGHSLKDRHDLWEAYKNLRTARNTFAHRGVATLGGKTVTEEQARGFIRNAELIGSQMRDWLPEEKRWPSVQLSNVDAQFSRLIKAAEPPQETSATDAKH